MLYQRYPPSRTVSQEQWSTVYISNSIGGTYLIRAMNKGAEMTIISSFKREADIARELYRRKNGPKYFFEPVDHTFDLIMTATLWKLPKATVPLSEYLHETNNRCNVMDFLDIAERMVQALHEVHVIGVIHRNITMGSFWINKVTKQIFLFDFFFTTHWREHAGENLRNSLPICGTLQYMSPEHTGKLDRPIDYRSDLYSLGIVWFAMLSGFLPFGGITAASAILFAQVAVEIPSLHVLELEEDIPIMLSKIISKLVTKNADERYQSAFGLLHDLRKCAEILRGKYMAESSQLEGVSISSQSDVFKEEFTLGIQDCPSSLSNVYDIIGREEELEKITGAYKHVASTSKPLPILIGGSSGIGKTSLVKSAFRAIKANENNEILLGKGKFAQYVRDVTGGFTNLFCSLLEKAIADHTEAAVARAVNKLSINDISLLSSQLVPTLREFCPSVEESSEEEPRSTVQYNQYTELAAVNLLTILSKLYDNRPMAILLDDVQWAEENSISLIKTILKSCKFALLVFLVYRDAEISPATLEDITQRYPEAISISLTELSKESTRHLISKILSINKDRVVDPLPQLFDIIFFKTKGNPFFVIQFMSKLYEEKLVYFDFEKRTWSCDLAAIRELHNTDDILDMMLAEIEKLPEDTKTVLQIASYLGNQFDVDTLSQVSDIQKKDLITILSPALFRGYIQTIYLPIVSKSTELSGTSEKDGLEFKFVHDRIREGFYTLVPLNNRPALHLKIGLKLKVGSPTSWSSSQLFSICNHLNNGRELIEDHAELESLVKLNLLASHQAQKTGAHSQGLDHGKATISILESLVSDPDEIWEKYYDFTLAAMHAITENEYLLGRYEQAAAEFDILLSKIKTKKQRVKSRRLFLSLCCTSRKYEEALHQGLLILQEYNFEIKYQNQSNMEKWKNFQSTVPGNCDPHYFKTLPINNDPDFMIPHMITADLVPIAYFLQSRDIYTSLPLSTIGACVDKKCRSNLLGPALAAFGMQYQMYVGPSKFSSEFCSVALDLSLETKDYWTITHTIVLVSLVSMFFQTLEENQKMINAVKITKIRTIDFNQLSHLAAFSVVVPMEFGMALPPLKDRAKQMLKLFKNLECSPLVSINGVLHAIDMLQHVNPAEYKGFVSNAGSEFWESCGELFRCLAFYVRGQIEESEKCLQFVESKLLLTEKLVPEIERAFLAPLIRKDSCSIELVQDCLEQLRQYSSISYDNFEHKYQVIKAELLRKQEKPIYEILECYENAIYLAEENGFHYVGAIAAERAYSLIPNKRLMANTFLKKSFLCYQEWGATAKCILLQQENPFLAENYISPRSSISVPKETSELTKPIRNHPVVLPNSNVNSSISLIELEHAEKLLGVVEHAGANRGFIFFVDKVNLYVLAQWGTATNEELVLYSLPQETENSQKLPCTPASKIKSEIPYTLILDASRGYDVSNPFDYFSEYKYGSQVKSAICIPMEREGEIIGILYLENTLTTGAFPTQHRIILQQLAAQIGNSIERVHTHIKMKKTLGDIQEEREMLLRLDKLKDEFVTNTSHELRTPLNAILGFSQTLQETKLTPEQSDYCSMITSAAEGLLSVINDILDIQQYQQNTLTITNCHFELRVLMDKIIRMISVDKPIIVNCLWHADLPPSLWLDGDHARLTQVFVNLLSNALKFTERGNVIVRVEPNNEYNDSAQNKIGLHFEVEDTGIGIDEKYINDLFKPFTQADSSTMRQYQGVGLGLAISQGIIQTLSEKKSVIKCSSTVGVGSIFSFDLSLTKVPEKEIPDVDNSELYNLMDNIKNSTIIYVGTNDYTYQSFIGDLSEIDDIKTIRTTSSDDAAKELAMSYENDNFGKYIFCVIDTEWNSVSEFDEQFELHKFLAEFIHMYNERKLYFVVLVPVAHRSNFHTFLSDHLQSIRHVSPIISIPMLKHSTVSTLGQLVAPEVNDEMKSFSVVDKYKVLMFEDNKMNQRVQERLLKMIGIECVTVENGMKGLEYLTDDENRMNEYDLILMDCHMPVMDGFKATIEIRELEKRYGKPRKHIIAVTAGQSFEECFAAGMCAVITKPVKKAVLSEVLSHFLSRPCYTTCSQRNYINFCA